MPLKLLVWSTTVLITCDLGQRCKVHSFQLPPVFQLLDNPSEETLEVVKLRRNRSNMLTNNENLD